ncbi:nucleoside/nucleotide kinase family protein [Oecophyllibacter saccharovorans]|nr:hypothetical protein [Oecophyllibacter saccharovorans]
MQPIYPTRQCHLGKQAGNLGRALFKLPMLGNHIAARSARETKRKKEKGFSPLGALVNFLFVIRRTVRFWRMRAYNAAGYAILADRYPQIACPGPMDGPYFSRAPQTGWLTPFLTALETRAFAMMDAFPPDLVIRLNVDPETAFARKPDHDPVKLAAKIRDVPRLRFRNAPIIDLDTRAPLKEVVAAASQAALGVMKVYGKVPREKSLPTPRGAVIALVGCDGSGKSSLSRELVAEIGQSRPTRYGYLGLGSGDLGRRIGRLPFIGPALEHKLGKRAKTTRTRGEKIPDLPTALVVFAFSLLRYRRFRQIQRAAARGEMVITDRYPQMEIPAQCDGPGLSAATSDNPLIQRLAAVERRLYQRMAARRPDLVVHLDIDPETAQRRKPDHDLEALRIKTSVMSRLRYNEAPRVVIDSRAPYKEVKRQVSEALRQHALTGPL